MTRNIALYPYLQASRYALVWQAVWFLYFQGRLSAPEALLLAALYDLGVVALEVPSGYFSDMIGRRLTLLIAMVAQVSGCLLLFTADSFSGFAAGQLLLGLGSAFASGTDSSLLYESLAALNRRDEVVQHEANAWRFAYFSLAASAVLGGCLASLSFSVTYLLSAFAAGFALVTVCLMREPGRTNSDHVASPLSQMRAIRVCLRDRTLLWVFGFAVVAIVLEDVPYIFLQPYLESRLSYVGQAHSAPLGAGLLIGAMMGLSAIASPISVKLLDRFGSTNALLLTLATQVLLVASMAWFVHPAAAIVLVMRMVPSALSHPIVIATVQPRLDSSHRATYLSFQNLSGRLLLSASVMFSAWVVTDTQTLDADAMATLLPGYAIAGGVALVTLWLTSRGVTRNTKRT